MKAVSDDNIDWDKDWIRHKNDKDFYDPNAFDYFIDLLPKGFKVLDLGCGSCKWYPSFKLAGCGEYIGVDFSYVAIEIARKKFPHLELYNMPVQLIGFENEFDLVFTHTLLQHLNIKTKRIVLPKIYKALVPNGIFVMQEKCDADTPTIFTRRNWIKFIESYRFKYIRGTPVGDPRNGFVFKVVK